MEVSGVETIDLNAGAGERERSLPQLPEVVTILVIAFWAFWFGRLTYGRFLGYSFGVFDLGIFDQGVWLLSQGLDPFVTLRGLHLFADHSSYILYLVAPLYAVWPDVRILLGLVVVAPAVAAWLAYRISVLEGLEGWIPAVVAMAVLVHPAMLWTPWDAFHPETLAIALIPGSYLAARRGRFWLAVVLGALLLMVKEDAFVVVLPLAAYFWWRWREARGHALILAGLAVLVAGVNFFLVLPSLSPTGELIYSGRLEGGLLSRLSWSRAGYLAAMLLPLSMSWAAPRFLLVAAPITGLNLVSAHGYQHEIQWHYTAYLLGVLAVAAPVGMARIRDRWGAGVRLGLIGDDDESVGVPFTGVIVVVSILAMLLLGPGFTQEGRWATKPPQIRAGIDSILQRIPDDAVVSASYPLATHLAHRQTIYMFPNPWHQEVWGVNDVYPPPPDPSHVEWVVIDHGLVQGSEDKEMVLGHLLATGWVIEATSADVALLRRDGS